MTVWEWLTTTTSVDALLQGAGLLTLAFLFARDLILTRGAHLRRVADLVDHHTRELAEKDARIAEIRESRQEWKDAAQLQSTRADAATSTVSAMAESLGRVEHVLESLDRALDRKGATG